MSEKIRKGNDIRIAWSLLDENEQPYNLEGRVIAIELDVLNKRVRIPQFSVSGNTVSFTYYGKDQKHTGSYALKFIENEGTPDMVTFDTKDAFTLVEHSWLAVDAGETPETIQIEVVTLTSALTERIGPKGDAAGFGTVDAEADANIGTPSVDVETSGPDTAKDIHFIFHNIKGEKGDEPVLTAGADGTIYSDGEVLTEVIKDAKTQAAADHATAVADHGVAANDHVVAVADHQQAGADHIQAGADHGVAVVDHTQASTDHDASTEATTKASNVNATISGTVVTITDKNGISTSVNIGFNIYRTYVSVAAMNADAANVAEGKFVMIATTDPTSTENAQLYVRNDNPPSAENPFNFLCDLDQAATSAWADWFENYKPTIESDHTRAEQDHTTASGDHGTAAADHTLAGTDHTQADSDHTRAGQDHTRAESDHSTASDDHTQAGTDHTQAGNDHTRAESDHGTASSDHTLAGTDHSTAAADHTQAGADHTTASSDHGIAAADHTQAESDHTRAESDHASIANKADRDLTATEGNIAVFDSTGNAVGSDLAKEDVAKKDGVYDELISGDVLAPYPLDREFTFDQTAGGADVGRKGARITGFKGKTLVWNQFAKAKGTNSLRGITFTYTSNRIVASGTPSQLYGGETVIGSPNWDSINTIIGHKYFYCIVGKCTGCSIKNSDRTVDFQDGMLSAPGSVYQPGVLLHLYQDTLQAIDIDAYFIAVDLTLAGIADQITTVADFKALYPNLDYSYNAGALINNAATALETVGFNQWDEETELGTLTADGNKSESTTKLRSKNFVPVFPSTNYYLRSASLFICYFDASKTFLSASNGYFSGAFTTPANCAYILFTMMTAYGTTYKNDICINLSSSRNGQYEPYQKNTLTLGLNSIACHDQNNNAVTVIGLDGVESVYDEGVVENGMLTKIIKRIGEVDLGDAVAAYTSGFFLILKSSYSLGAVNSNTSLVSRIYTIYNSYSDSNLAIMEGAYISSGFNGYVAIRNTSYTTVADFKSAMSGVKLRYKLATPLILTLDTPIPVDYIAGYTEKRLPEDTASAVSAPMEMSVRYSSNAGPILQKIQTTFNNLLNAFKTAGKIASFTNNFDDGEGKFTIY